MKMVNNVYGSHTSESELGAFTALRSQCNLKNLTGNQTVIYLTHYGERTKKKSKHHLVHSCAHCKSKTVSYLSFVMIFYAINILVLENLFLLLPLIFLCSIIGRNTEAK